jgi:hypothetical protein
VKQFIQNVTNLLNFHRFQNSEQFLDVALI